MGELGTFRQQLKTDSDTDQRSRREYEQDELFWTKVAAIAAISFSFFSLILSCFTLKVLSGQATIMATQAALTKQQLDDSEALQAAWLIIENFKITVLQPYPNFRFRVDSCAIRNVGNSMANKIGAAFQGGSFYIFKRREPYRDPRKTVTIAPAPNPGGPSLAKGETRPCGDGFEGSSGNFLLGQAPDYEDYRTVTVSWIDIFGHPHSTNDCLMMRTNFRPPQTPRDRDIYLPCPNGQQDQ